MRACVTRACGTHELGALVVGLSTSGEHALRARTHARTVALGTYARALVRAHTPGTRACTHQARTRARTGLVELPPRHQVRVPLQPAHPPHGLQDVLLGARHAPQPHLQPSGGGQCVCSRVQWGSAAACSGAVQPTLGQCSRACACMPAAAAPLLPTLPTSSSLPLKPCAGSVQPPKQSCQAVPTRRGCGGEYPRGMQVHVRDNSELHHGWHAARSALQRADHQGACCSGKGTTSFTLNKMRPGDLLQRAGSVEPTALRTSRSVLLGLQSAPQAAQRPSGCTP